MSADEQDKKKGKGRGPGKGKKKGGGGNGKAPPPPSGAAAAGADGQPVFHKVFRFDLADKAKAELGSALAELTVDIESVDVERKARAADYTAKLRYMRKDQRRRAQVLRAGYELRQVDCIVRRHPSRPIMQLVRLDTGAVFDERPMTAEEQQVTLEDQWQKLQAKLAAQLDPPAPPAPKERKAKAKPAPKPPGCPVPEPHNPSGLCDADPDPGNEGLCKWHGDKYPTKEERKALHKAAKTKRAGQDTLPAAPAVPPVPDKPPYDDKANELGDHAQQCLQCGQVPCVCPVRPGDAPDATH